MKLDTPPMASAPYVADAPPEMISIFLIIDDWMLFTSTTISALVGTARRPSMSTRLRLAPKPRNEIDAMPTEFTDEICTSEFVASEVGVAAGLYAGIWFRYDSMLRPDLLSSTALS